MSVIIICACILINIVALIDFLKPFYQSRLQKGGATIKLISPVGNYLILFLALIGAIVFMIGFLKEKSLSNFILFTMLFLVSQIEMTKSYALICQEGLYIGGVYYSYSEKQEAQYVTDIIGRRIYAIRTEKKYAYVYLAKKYIDKITAMNK